MKQASNSLRHGIVLVLVGVLCGCAHQPSDKPTMQPGNGAIKGKLMDSAGEPFDVSLVGEGGARKLQIQLISSTAGVVANTMADSRKPEFVFSNVAPGRYELTVYDVIPDKRTIAGNQTVTVDPDQTASVTITLQVTEQK